MKKFLSTLTLAALTLTLAVALPVAANAETYVDTEGEIAPGVAAPSGGAITATEQKILDELNKGVKMGGFTFKFTSSEMNSASNYLKRIDATEAQVAEVVAQIQAGRKIFEAQNVAVNGSEMTIHTIVRKMTPSVKEQLAATITAAGKPIGLTITWNKGVATFVESGTAGSATVTDKKGNTVISSGSTVKTTGSSLSAGAAVLTVLTVASVAGYTLNKKYGREQKLIAE